MSIKKNAPFLMTPAAKDYLWGGNRLNTVFGKNIDMTPLAETWECSVHPDGPSVVASGEFCGRLLLDVLNEYPQYLGKNCEKNGLPVLIKFIDAKQNLSVQVHPDDSYACKYENGQNGKNEMWYVLDAEPGAALVIGMKRKYTKDEILSAINEGRLEECLNRIEVKKGDAFFIPAGTVHAICAGSLIAEIQQNSNLTYRLYDYNRVGADGKKRQLHAEKALDVADLSGKIPQTSENHNTGENATVCENRFFRVTKLEKECKNFAADRDSFRVLLCISGDGKLKYRGGEISFKAGDCVFCPANSYRMNITGNYELLITDIP